MKRTKSHQIDTKAQNILRSKFPTDWVVREQHPDYGIDYEVEVFCDEQPTGIWFRVQLKGKEKYRETEDSIAIPFETDKIRYYLSMVPFPVFIFLVHVGKEEIHWLFLQKYVNEVLSVENPKWFKRRQVTIKIPKKNIFVDNAKEIESEARDGMVYTHLLRFGIPHWSLHFGIMGAIDDVDRFETERKKYLRQQNEMDLQLASKYYELENREGSWQLFADVFNRTKGKDDSVLEHLSSIAGIISFYSVLDEAQNSEVLGLSSYGGQIAERLHNKRFMYFFRGSLLEASYIGLMKRIQNNRMFQRIVDEQERGTGPLLRLLQSEDYTTLMKVSREYSRNVLDSFEHEEYWVSLDLLVRHIRMSLFQYPWLITESTKEELAPLLENVSYLIESCLALAYALDYASMKCELLKNKALLLHYRNNEKFKDVLESMRTLASEHGLNYYVELSMNLLREFDERSPFPEGPDDFPKPPPIEEIPEEEINEMYRVLIKAAGIDLEKDDDMIANVVRIGLRDRNPERILKDCSHLEVATGHYGMPGEMLGLPTAGSKFLHCKYAGGVYGLSLDSLYVGFKKDHCTDCEHRDPMPKDWKWSLKWQEERDKQRSDEFQRFIDAF